MIFQFLVIAVHLWYYENGWSDVSDTLEQLRDNVVGTTDILSDGVVITALYIHC